MQLLLKGRRQADSSTISKHLSPLNHRQQRKLLKERTKRKTHVHSTTTATPRATTHSATASEICDVSRS